MALQIAAEPEPNADKGLRWIGSQSQREFDKAGLGELGVGVFEIRPGVIRTDMTAVAAADYDHRIAAGLSPMPRWGEPADVGRAVAALAAGMFPFSTGDAIHVDGGLHVQRL